MTDIDWAHRESLRMWSVLAARGHEGAQAVASYHGIAPVVAPPPPRSVPAPATVSATVPRPPRATVPTAPQPTVASSGLQRRIDQLTRLVNPPAPPTDLV
jgi:hypothetical protein